LTPLPSFPILCLAAVPGKAEGGQVFYGDPVPYQWYVMERVKAMGLRRFIEALRTSGRLASVSKTVSKDLEVAAVLNALDEKPVLFEAIGESAFKVVGNLFGTKQ